MKADHLMAGTLAARLRTGPLERGELERLASDLLEMLASLHAAGTLHTDLNPDSVRLDGNGRLHSSKVGPQRGGDGRSTGSTGSAKYLAPELLGGHPADVAADLFACGVLLSECAGADASAPVLVLIGMLTATEPVLRPASATEALALLNASVPVPAAPVAIPPVRSVPVPLTPGQNRELPTEVLPQVPSARPAPPYRPSFEKPRTTPGAEVPHDAVTFPPVLNFPSTEPSFAPAPADRSQVATFDMATLDASFDPAPFGGTLVAEQPPADVPEYRYRRRPSGRVVIAVAAALVVLGGAVGIGVGSTGGSSHRSTVPPPAAGAPLAQHLDGLDRAIDGLAG